VSKAQKEKAALTLPFLFAPEEEGGFPLVKTAGESYPTTVQNGAIHDGVDLP
jgi:hypothetical protein